MTAPGLREAALLTALMLLALFANERRPDRGREPVSPDLKIAEMVR